MTMRALYIREDTDKRLDALVRVNVDGIREANAITEYDGITSDNIVNWLIGIAKDYFKLGRPEA